MSQYRYYVETSDKDYSPQSLYRSSTASGVEQYVQHRNAWVKLISEAWDWVTPGFSSASMGTKPISEDEARALVETIPDQPEEFLNGLEDRTAEQPPE